MKQTTLSCSFCHKTNKDVACLIAGPTCLICDECVSLCVDVFSERGVKISTASQDRLDWALVAAQLGEPWLDC